MVGFKRIALHSTTICLTGVSALNPFKSIRRTLLTNCLPYLKMSQYPVVGKPQHCIADVHLVPMFTDNYGYLVVDPGSNRAFTVDPGDGQAIYEATKALGLTLTTVLCTHKHADHVGGNQYLKSQIPELEIIGTKYEEIPGVTKQVGDGEEFTLFDNALHVRTIYSPCHTAGHVLYHVTKVDNQDNDRVLPMLFSGDTLFVGGCGRFFEGTAAQMLENMDKIATLPHNTLVFCAHEYTESNYRFLAHVDPSLQGKYEEIKNMRASKIPTVPSTIADELQHNLFARCREEHVQTLMGASNDPVAAMQELRNRKNNFK
jgi:hydroxyacylglutathione hydrolase